MGRFSELFDSLQHYFWPVLGRQYCLDGWPMERKEIWMVRRSFREWIDMLDVVFHSASALFLRVAVAHHRPAVHKQSQEFLSSALSGQRPIDSPVVRVHPHK